MPRHPRWLKENTAYSETQRTVDRQFLFKPSPLMRNLVGSCAARAQKKFPIKLYWLDFNINHKHTGRAALSGSPRHLENLVRFDQTFHSLLTREINRLYEREGPLFSTRNRSHEATDDDALEEQLFYAVTNMVKDGMVDRAAHWEGLSSYNQLATGEVDTYTYIDRTAWHRAGGKRSKKPPETFTRTITLELSPIPEWEGMSPGQRQAHFRREVRRREASFRESREVEGRGVMGRRRLAKVDPRDRPKTRKPKGREPVCHSSTARGELEYKEALRSFIERYRRASRRWLDEDWQVQFPDGSIRPPPLMVSVSC